MPILIAHDLACLSALPQILFRVLEHLLAKDGQAFIEVSHRKDDARSTCESVNLSASVAKSSQELLDETYLVHDVQMTELIDILE